MMRLFALSAALLVVFAQAAGATPILVNANFDEPALTGFMTYTTPYGTLDAATGVPGWTLAETVVGTAHAGMAKNGANGLVLDGQGVFMEGTAWVSQSIADFMAGTLVVGFYNTAPAAGSGSPANPLQVTLDGTVLTFGGSSTLTPPANAMSWVETDPILIDAGTHVLKFSGTGTVPNPYMPGAAIDGVAISGTSVAEVPEPGTIVLMAIGLIGLLCYAWRKRK